MAGSNLDMHLVQIVKVFAYCALKKKKKLSDLVERKAH